MKCLFYLLIFIGIEMQAQNCIPIINTLQKKNQECLDKGVNMLIFLDFRDTKKDVNSASDFIEMFNDRVNDITIDEEIEIHRQDKRYTSAFTIGESLKDFKEWKDSLLLMFKGDDAVNIQIQDFKQEVEKLESELKEKIYSICEKLDYKNSSRFGRTIDRLEQFAKDVKEFSNNE